MKNRSKNTLDYSQKLVRIIDKTLGRRNFTGQLSLNFKDGELKDIERRERIKPALIE